MRTEERSRTNAGQLQALTSDQVVLLAFSARQLRRNWWAICEQCNRDKYCRRSDRQQIADFRLGRVVFEGAAS